MRLKSFVIKSSKSRSLQFQNNLSEEGFLICCKNFSTFQFVFKFYKFHFYLYSLSFITFDGNILSLKKHKPVNEIKVYQNTHNF